MGRGAERRADGLGLVTNEGSTTMSNTERYAK